MKRPAVIIGLWLLLALPALAQQGEDRFADYAQLLSPEKVYLHTDREVYNVGDTIWFKGYLGNAAQLAEFPACNYLYVELISSMYQKNVNLGRSLESEQVRARVKVKRRENGFAGWLVVPDNLNTGIATLRAYSYWMLNREPEYMFHKDVELRNPMKDDFVDNLAKSNVKDDYKYTDVGMANPFDQGKSVKRTIDVQFLPESGRWLYGQQSVLGIRAVDPDGHGIPVRGEIFADEVPAGSFETDSRGMGRAVLLLDTAVKDLYAQVYEEEAFAGRFKLPLPVQAGAAIHVSVRDDSVEASVHDKGLLLPDSTFLVVHDRDEIYIRMPYSLKTKNLKIPYALLSPGINNLALVGEDGTVYAERAFFVYPEQSAVSLHTDKSLYGPRERVGVTADLPEGDYSVSVSDDGYAPYSGKGYDLVSWWYLGSELPSFVEEAQSYFDGSRPLAERIQAMDAVMLTHAWTYYELPKILAGETAMPYFGKEYSQSISGVVRGSLRTARKSIVSFIAPAIGFSAMGQLDTSGYFVLNGLDFPENTQFLVGAVSLGGNTRRFTPYLDDDIFAKFHHYPAYLDKPAYSQEYKQDILWNYYNAGGEIIYSLHPSYVTGTASPRQENISPLPDYEFKPGQYRPERDLEPYKAMDVLTYIVTTCPPLRFAEGDETPMGLFATEQSDSTGTVGPTYRSIVCRTQKVSTVMGISSGWEEIIVFMNGMRSSCEELEGINVSDLTGFAYITGADAMMFNTGMDNALAPKSVVMVKTRSVAHGTAVNVSTGKPLGWQQPRYFYSPRYEDARSRKAPEPVRATLYWNPDLVAEPGETTQFDFYTSDHKADATVIIEGFTKEGVPLSIKGKVRR